MAVTTILVESKQTKIQEWTDYIKEFDRETSKTAAQDVTGLGTPQTATGETLEEVLDLLGNASGGVAVIYAHASPNGLIMRITANSNSAHTKNIRGISRAWKAVFEIIALRSGQWPTSGKPVFLIDVPKAVALFKTLVEELNKLPGSYASRLPDPTTVTNRDQADAWFDKWMDLMAKACLGGGLGETDLRRVCRAMQKVRDKKFERVEIRACNIGQDKENLKALKEFFGVATVIAPKVTMFFGRVGVNLNATGDLNTLAGQLGGFRGTTFTAPSRANHNLNRIQGGEAQVATGRRNRIFPDRPPTTAIMQLTQDQPFHFLGRLFSTTAVTMTQFLQANYKAGHTFRQQASGQPVGGMWTADAGGQVPFVLPLEAAYRTFLESSD